MDIDVRNLVNDCSVSGVNAFVNPYMAGFVVECYCQTSLSVGGREFYLFCAIKLVGGWSEC
jgi:hypothetical protein